jgi:leader peptidase (prepilin peptidase) / N-methyltransferase
MKDVKLAASIGLALGWVGWQALLVGTFTGFAPPPFTAACSWRAPGSRTSLLPLGPFILLGALTAIALLRV